MTLLRIGAFARAASVSIKTLRFYERVGVFQPACVDTETGYRYYDFHQLETLRELRALRHLSCSVAELRVWAEHQRRPATRLAMLRNLRHALYDQLARDRLRLHQVEAWIRKLEGPSEGSRAPTLRSIPPIPALTIRERVRTVHPAVYRMFEAAERRVAQQRARTSGRPFLLLHDGCYLERNADVEVCIPVDPASLSALGGSIIPGARRAACLTFDGSYGGAAEVHESLRRWVQTNAGAAAGPLREVYVRFAADQRGYRLPKRLVASTVSELRTELQIPLLITDR